MSNKYDSSEHIKVLAELTILYQLVNETREKINVAEEKEKKMEQQRKVEDEIPF